MTQQGFDTWVGALRKISESQQLNLHMYPSEFHQQCQNIVRSKIIQEWAADIADTSKHPILRTYRYTKSSFRTEPYLYLVNDKRAISQLRCSSHILNVEKGRYTRPRTPLDERLCNMCNCVDDELHFITACAVNVNERRALYDKLIDKFPEFGHLCDLEKMYFCLPSMMLKCCHGLANSCIDLSNLNPSKRSACRTWNNYSFCQRSDA